MHVSRSRSRAQPGPRRAVPPSRGDDDATVVQWLGRHIAVSPETPTVTASRAQSSETSRQTPLATPPIHAPPSDPTGIVPSREYGTLDTSAGMGELNYDGVFPSLRTEQRRAARRVRGNAHRRRLARVRRRAVRRCCLCRLGGRCELTGRQSTLRDAPFGSGAQGSRIRAPYS